MIKGFHIFFFVMGCSQAVALSFCFSSPPKVHLNIESGARKVRKARNQQGRNGFSPYSPYGKGKSTPKEA